VLLIEQFRAGPARRGDPNPWTLEPVAGIVDAGEAPEDAARREAAEEAGLAIRATERMFSFYPTPGSDTDHFYCYLGLCDLTPEGPGFGGLADEAEDIRLHLMARAEALALVESGEITTGPLIAMLYWLDRQAARLRAAAGVMPGGTA
jgi:nudix-type nucleoside diphosphatase (YffH/AdpP family)